MEAPVHEVPIARRRTSSGWQFDLDLNLAQRRCGGPVDSEALPVDANRFFRAGRQFFYGLAGHQEVGSSGTYAL